MGRQRVCSGHNHLIIDMNLSDDRLYEACFQNKKVNKRHFTLCKNVTSAFLSSWIHFYILDRRHTGSPLHTAHRRAGTQWQNTKNANIREGRILNMTSSSTSQSAHHRHQPTPTQRERGRGEREGEGVWVRAREEKRERDRERRGEIETERQRETKTTFFSW